MLVSTLFFFSSQVSPAKRGSSCTAILYRDTSIVIATKLSISANLFLDIKIWRTERSQIKRTFVLRNLLHQHWRVKRRLCSNWAAWTYLDWKRMDLSNILLWDQQEKKNIKKMKYIGNLLRTIVVHSCNMDIDICTFWYRYDYHLTFGVGNSECGVFSATFRDGYSLEHIEYFFNSKLLERAHWRV